MHHVQEQDALLVIVATLSHQGVRRLERQDNNYFPV
jgi:hypothetical protein